MAEILRLGRKEIRGEGEIKEKETKKKKKAGGGEVLEKWTDGVNIQRSILKIETNWHKVSLSSTRFPRLSATVFLKM